MTTKEHLTKHDKEIAAIRTLIRQGMRMLVEQQRLTLETQKIAVETRKDLRELAATVKKLIRPPSGIPLSLH